MKKITVSKKIINIISFIIFLVILFISIIYQYLNSTTLIIQSNFMFAISPIVLLLFHEAFHYFGFLAANVSIEQLVLKPIKPYHLAYISTNIPLLSVKYITMLVLPTIILSTFAIIPVLYSPNILSSFILSICIAMGTGDMLLALKLLKLEKSKMVIPCDEEWGVFVLDTLSKDTKIS